MSKFILLTVLFYILLFPHVVSAQSISPIGDLNVGESKDVTISDLQPNAKYYWKESKLTEAALPVKQYTLVFKQCFFADNNRIFEDQIKALSVGVYQLEIYRVYASDCRPVRNPAVSQEFWVGGSTRTSCCTPLFPVYDKDKNVCKQQLISIPGKLNPEQPTECKKEASYCEPESLQCFKTQTFVRGKICATPDDVKRDPGKYTICATSGGNPCDQNNKDNPGVQTAIGCIHTTPVGFVKDALKFVIGISGGLAFLMMLLGAFQMMTSAGNPDTLQAGRDRFQSAIIGLLLVIFATLLLQIIGVDILKLPGFNR